jgi:hypothetical protein
MKRSALTLLFAVILPVGITWAADFPAGSMGLRQGGLIRNVRDES